MTESQMEALAGIICERLSSENPGIFVSSAICKERVQGIRDDIKDMQSLLKGVIAVFAAIFLAMVTALIGIVLVR